MATVIGDIESLEGALLREALDGHGSADEADPYAVRVFHGTHDEAPRSPVVPAGRTLIVMYLRERRWRDSWTILARGFDDVITWARTETVDVVLARVERWREVDRILTTKSAASVWGSSPALLQALGKR